MPLLGTRWPDPGERVFPAQARGFLSGLASVDTSEPRLTAATNRRVVMLNEGGRWRGHQVWLQVPWTSVVGHWRGIVDFPPDLWSEGPSGEVIVLCLEPAAAGGKDLVIYSNLDGWSETIRSVGLDEIKD